MPSLPATSSPHSRESRSHTRPEWTTSSDTAWEGEAYWGTRAAAGRKPGRARGRDVAYRSDAYIVDIRLPSGVVPFRLGRKAKAYAAMGGGRPMRFVKSIEPAGSEECVCIRVAAPDS